VRTLPLAQLVTTSQCQQESESLDTIRRIVYPGVTSLVKALFLSAPVSTGTSF
jgi:hypothetical protein